MASGATSSPMVLLTVLPMSSFTCVTVVEVVRPVYFTIDHDGRHRDGNLVLGLGVAELIDGTGGGRDLLQRVGVGLLPRRV